MERIAQALGRKKPERIKRPILELVAHRLITVRRSPGRPNRYDIGNLRTAYLHGAAAGTTPKNAETPPPKVGVDHPQKRGGNNTQIKGLFKNNNNRLRVKSGKPVRLGVVADSSKLINLGVGRRIATDLTEKYGAERIDEVVANAPKDSGPGWVVKALREEWIFPAKKSMQPPKPTFTKEQVGEEEWQYATAEALKRHPNLNLDSKTLPNAIDEVLTEREQLN